MATIHQHSKSQHVIFTAEVGDVVDVLNDPIVTWGQDLAMVTLSGRVRITAKAVVPEPKKDVRGKNLITQYGHSGMAFPNDTPAPTELKIWTRPLGGDDWLQSLVLGPEDHLDYGYDFGRHTEIRVEVVAGGPVTLIEVQDADQVDGADKQAGSGASDPGVEGASVIQFPDFVHLATGEGPVWQEVTYDDAGLPTRTWFYLDANGDTQMTDGNKVGRNEVAAKQQFIGSFHIDYHADGSDLTKTADDIIADAIAAGAEVYLSDGTSQALTAADFIARIDVDLKYVGGHGDVAGVQKTATAADATFKDGGSVTDIDPGGSRSSGAQRAPDGFYLKKSFEEIVVKDGSIVTVGVEFATLPA